MTERILFGEFLVEKNLIKPQEILGLLIDQVRSQPSIAEIVYKNRLLTEAEQLQILRVQSQTGWDYQQACVDLHIWNDKLAGKIMELSAKNRIPLGQLIVSKGLMSAADLTRALDDFVGFFESTGAVQSRGDRTPPSVPPMTTDNTEVESVSASKVIPIGIASLSNQLEPNFTMIDPVLLGEFVDLLPDSRLKEIEQVTGSWRIKIQNGDYETVVSELQAIGREMDAIRGAARFIRAELVEQIMYLGSIMITSVTSKPESFGHLLGDLVSTCTNVYEIVFKIKQVLVSERSEKSIWMSSDSRKSYEDTVSSLKQVMSLLVA